MKPIFRTLIIAMAMIIFTLNTFAQNNSSQRMSREQLAETQAKYIAKEMKMDKATEEKFSTTFCQFQKEIWALGPRPQRRPINQTDTETEEALKERFEHSQKILDLRKKYYEEYSKFLTQKQIMRVYELERRMMDRLYHRTQKKRTQD